MNKDNQFKSSNFYMSEGDVLHMIFLDEQGVPVTVDLQATPAPGEVINVVPGQVVAKTATEITDSSFTANWNLMENATGYYFDVHTDPLFPDDDPSAPFIIDNHDAGNNTSHAVNGLDLNYTYYYRVRAYNDIGTGISSETITTHLVVNDLFLPSKDELNAVRINLGITGTEPGFDSNYYWSSSEDSATKAWVCGFNIGSVDFIDDKSSGWYVLPIRTFISALSYSFWNLGPAGGYIFSIIDNGNGTFTYSEVYAPVIPLGGGFPKAWSNIVNLLAGTGTAIGTGQANTTAITGQVGHTDSAAKLCDDLIL